MLWAGKSALAGILLGCASTAALAADVDLIGATHHTTTHHKKTETAANVTATPAPPDDASADAPDGQWTTDAKTGCRVLDANYDDGDAVSWSGECRNGLAEGPGTLAFTSDGSSTETLTATLHRGVVQDGHVVVAWADGSKYDGAETGGHMNGAGVFTSAKHDRLEGQWTNDVLGGNVRIAWANGDRYEGGWRDGQANGSGTEIWANGDRYDGEWRDGKAEGTGSEKWADGRAFNGEWHGDKPVRTNRAARADAPPNPNMAMGAPNAAMAPVMPAQMASAVANTAGTLAVAPMGIVAGTAPAQSDAQGKVAILDGLDGTRLVSVDGSTIAFTANEAGFTREIARADGPAQATSFNFINDRLGTVANAQDESQTIGLFRVTDSEIDVDYADGRSEVLKPNPTGGLSIALAAPDGRSYCMSWYPQGHVFSDVERKAAVAAYADRLSASSGPMHEGTCTDSSIAQAAAAHAESQSAPVPTANLQNIPRPIPKPMRVSFVTPAPAIMPASTPAVFAQTQPGVVVVRQSNVHTIDAGADPMAPASPQAMLEQPPETASTCLSVESDGTHWGFRNRCGFSVQFSYCLMGDAGGLASCSDGGVAGSVAPNGFGALVADKSIQETGNEHDFRWIACNGGAGEVVPHLDKTDPPAGRCVRPKAS